MGVARFIATSLLLCAVASCNNSEFAGNSGKVSKAPASPTPAAPRKSETTVASKATDDGTVLGKTGDSRVKPATDASNAFPQAHVDSGQDSGGGSALVDMLNGLLGNGAPNVDSGDLGRQPDDNNIIFGDGRTFHIGDGQMTQSSCLNGISPYPVSGKQYLFEFDVLTDGQVAVDIGLVCGIDYGDSNLVYFAQNGAPIGQSYPLPKGATQFQIPATQLVRGRYQVGIESRLGTQEPEGNPSDADDYVLGQVHIQSRGAKIKIGKVLVN